MLVLEKVKKSYPTHPVLQDLSATFQRGKSYLILGANGAGKSTLFKCIAGDEKINAGSITTNDKSASHEKNDTRRTGERSRDRSSSNIKTGKYERAPITRIDQKNRKSTEYTHSSYHKLIPLR